MLVYIRVKLVSKIYYIRVFDLINEIDKLFMVFILELQQDLNINLALWSIAWVVCTPNHANHNIQF